MKFNEDQGSLSSAFQFVKPNINESHFFSGEYCIVEFRVPFNRLTNLFWRKGQERVQKQSMDMFVSWFNLINAILFNTLHSRSLRVSVVPLPFPGIYSRFNSVMCSPSFQKILCHKYRIYWSYFSIEWKWIIKNHILVQNACIGWINIVVQK